MVNCFLLFCSKQRKAVTADYPNKSNADITSKLAEMWRHLPQEEKEYYKNLAYKTNSKKTIQTSHQKQYQFQFKLKTKSSRRNVVVHKNRNNAMAPKLPSVTQQQEQNNIPQLPSIQHLLCSLKINYNCVNLENKSI